MASKQRLVIVGNGMAGARTLEEILSRDGASKFDIAVFGDEPNGNYNRILLSGVLNGSHKPNDIYLNPRTWYADNGITLHAPSRVVSLDRPHKHVVSDCGIIEPYDTLIVSTGSRATIPVIDGLNGPSGAPKHGVFVFRTLEDCRKIAGCANKCQRAVVVGGGLLGLEAAKGLLKYGVAVHLVHNNNVLMNAQLDVESGQILRKCVEQMGIQVHLGQRTTAVCGDEYVTGITFTDGTVLETDMIIFACGISPNVEVAKESGLITNRGILVDDHMRTLTDPSVFAVGECAEHNGVTYGLVAPLWDQAVVVADNVTEFKTPSLYKGSKLMTKLKVMGISLTTMGLREPEFVGDHVITYSDPTSGNYHKLIIRNDRLIGAILLGETEKTAELVQAFDRGTPLAPDRRTLLFPMQQPTRPSTGSALLEMPDNTKICNCIGVTKGAIRKCVEAGNRSLTAVQDATRACSGCGTCKPLVQEIVTWCCDGLPTPEKTATAKSSGPFSVSDPDTAKALKTLIKELVAWAAADD